MSDSTRQPSAQHSQPVGGTPTHVNHGNLHESARMYFSRQLALFDTNVKQKLQSEQCDVSPITDIQKYTIPRVQDNIKDCPSFPNEFKRIRIERIRKQQSTKTTQQTPGSSTAYRPTYRRYVGDDEYAIIDNVRSPLSGPSARAFLHAGPRQTIPWKPGEVKACIVTCGGLCPGLNNVIQELFYCLHYNYGVDVIYGIRSGYRGFWQPQYQPWLRLTPELVEDIHEQGGSILGSSRGGFDGVKMVNALEVYGVNQVYVIGGDGTHRGANALYQEACRRGLKISVACIPKTIDNDIGTIDRSFGFNTAVAEARKAILGAVTSAQSTANGVAIVKLMGRHAGYIAAHATIASRNVDVCLIPEVPFPLHGSGGLLRHIQRVVSARDNAVIVVAEGAGEDWFNDDQVLVGYDDERSDTNDDENFEIAKAAKAEKTQAIQNEMKKNKVVDESGNKKLPDVGTFLCDTVRHNIRVRGRPVNVIYTDPSYTIRSVHADAEDSVLCLFLASNAVHGAMAGYTGFSVATVNGRNVMIPIEVIVASSPAYMNPNGTVWQTVVNLTHQPHTVPQITHVDADVDQKQEQQQQQQQQPPVVDAKL